MTTDTLKEEHFLGKCFITSQIVDSELCKTVKALFVEKEYCLDDKFVHRLFWCVFSQ